MEHAGFQHQAVLYEGADEYLAGTIPFLRAALGAGEPALVAVKKEQADLLRGELGREAGMMRFASIEGVARNPAGKQLCDLVQIRSGEGGTVVRLHVLGGQHASDYDHQDPAYA